MWCPDLEQLGTICRHQTVLFLGTPRPKDSEPDGGPGLVEKICKTIGNGFFRWLRYGQKRGQARVAFFDSTVLHSNWSLAKKATFSKTDCATLSGLRDISFFRRLRWCHFGKRHLLKTPFCGETEAKTMGHVPAPSKQCLDSRIFVGQIPSAP